MISTRTKLLALLLLLSSIGLGWVLHRRQRLCAELPHGFARRAPIAGASGRDTFVCKAMVERMTAAEKGVAVVWWVSVLGFARSAWIDKEARRARRRVELGLRD